MSCTHIFTSIRAILFKFDINYMHKGKQLICLKPYYIWILYMFTGRRIWMHDCIGWFCFPLHPLQSSYSPQTSSPNPLPIPHTPTEAEPCRTAALLETTLTLDPIPWQPIISSWQKYWIAFKSGITSFQMQQDSIFSLPWILPLPLLHFPPFPLELLFPTGSAN